jgi:pimeloyl-ACP methyl ester carboxylesterase
MRARSRGVPRVLLPLGVRAAEGRAHLRGGSAAGPGDRLGQAAHPGTLSVPTLVAHGPDDTIASFDASRELARRRADLVALHTVAHAGHAAMWNADPDRYDEVLRRFLTPLV